MSKRYNQLLKRWKDNLMSDEPAAVRHAKALKIEANIAKLQRIQGVLNNAKTIQNKKSF